MGLEWLVYQESRLIGPSCIAWGLVFIDGCPGVEDEVVCVSLAKSYIAVHQGGQARHNTSRSGASVPRARP